MSTKEDRLVAWATGKELVEAKTQPLDNEQKEKLNNAKNTTEFRKLVWGWIKQGKINFKQFSWILDAYD